MWWKALSVVIILYSLLAGLLVPLKPGIVHIYPESVKTGQTVDIKFYGYNSFFTKGGADTRVWLEYDSDRAIMGQNIRVINDTLLEASFQIPKTLPKHETSMVLTAIADSPADGNSILPSALQVVQDTALANAGDDPLWTANPIKNIHLKSGFSFPYRNVIYETIRNTYYHVPMWFAMFFVLAMSVWYSIKYLRQPDLDNDRKAVAFAETGLLFGFLGLFTGMIWAYYAWGAAWSNDIKQLMTAVALLIYVAYFILRSSFDEPEKGARLAAVYNIFAFASLIPLLYIVPRLFASLHPGATGSPAFGTQDLDNTMKMVFRPAVFGWLMFSYWLATLVYRTKRIEDKLMDID